MNYEHSNSKFESGDSMGNSNSGESPSSKPLRKTSSPGTSSNSGTSQSSTSSASANHRCSYCGQPFVRELSRHMPFCSKRCQQIDLGMWLTESYGLPHEGESSLDSYGIEEEVDDQ